MSEAQLKAEAEELEKRGIYTDWLCAKLMRITLGTFKNRKRERPLDVPPLTPEGTIAADEFHKWNRQRLIRAS